MEEYKLQNETLIALNCIEDEGAVILTFINNYLKNKNLKTLAIDKNILTEIDDIQLQTHSSSSSSPIIIALKKNGKVRYAINCQFKVLTNLSFIDCFMLIPKIIYTFELEYPEELINLFLFFEKYLDFGSLNKKHHLVNELLTQIRLL